MSNTPKKLSFAIDGMTCQACAMRIEKVLNKKDGVVQAQVNFASEEAQVLVSDHKLSAQDIIGFIQKTGYRASLKKEGEIPQITVKHMSWRLWLLLVINIPFLIGMAGMLIGRHDWMLPPIWQWVLASIVQLFLAIPFYKSAWGSIKGGLANMDVLVTIGTIAIYLYSTYMLFFYPHTGHEGGMPHVYFEASVMVIGFVSFGKFLEESAKKNSLNSLGMLLKLRPSQVNVKREDQWHSIPIDQVQLGEIIRANHGERIAADGMVISGTGWTDESHLTGESQPEEKKAGSKVLAGSLVSDGSLIYQAEQLGSQTLLGDMMSALSEAQGSKAPIARIADKVSGIFVPVVVLIALITFIVTGMVRADWTVALMNAVAVLVIACPCALGLATPAAIMVGMGQAVKRGIWFKDATVIEEAAHVNAVVLDKTGTLTEGKPTVNAIFSTGTYSENELLRIAASVEQSATHPLARAIVNAAQAQSLALIEPQQVESVTGEGIRAVIDGIGVVHVGKPSFCHFDMQQVSGEIWSIASVVAVSVDGKAVGAFALADALKEDTAKAIARLQAHHIDVYVMSGDHQQVVSYVANALGIQYAFGNMSPRDKAEKIQSLKAEGKVVAMVGDGVNDAPALAAANVSFAMKGGADVAENTASATLMQQSVNQMVDALLVSRATLKNIKQNLFFAFIYNIIGIPLAALGFLNPIIAGAAMALSSVSVLSNALRLKYIKID
ncbi:cadmium-translocating P-type ATPase [Pelistega sp. NLN82]|uniref:Cadmium-translocating P-type ATPase n=1 Tax=Pelistega ratti TaxID=2652177 RepID=A0A6L9Y831_9BURK|nr:heavy metal translocating P-type ATPase [Pelistega ratti]NEN75978.1 cadmium-translocating P-type ATPase [Pelistega ratti]